MSLQALHVPPAVPAFRPFAVRVSALRRLSAHFLRITFTGTDLDELSSGGADQRIKLIFPLVRGGRPDVPSGLGWYAAWRALPAAARCPMRTYTVRAARPLQHEIDVDVVLHGATGPASRWAETAEVGDQIAIVGPNARFDGDAGGVEWRPPTSARALLLVGDETAVPAISAIAEALPTGTGAQAVLEVPTASDVLDLDVAADVQVTWLPRRHGGVVHPRGDLLDDAVRACAGVLAASAPVVPVQDLDPNAPVWEVPQDGPDLVSGAYVWLAGEAGVVTQLRRHLLREVGLDRRAVAFMGYWRSGRGEAG